MIENQPLKKVPLDLESIDTFMENQQIGKKHKKMVVKAFEKYKDKYKDTAEFISYLSTQTLNPALRDLAQTPPFQALLKNNPMSYDAYGEP